MPVRFDNRHLVTRRPARACTRYAFSAVHHSVTGIHKTRRITVKAHGSCLDLEIMNAHWTFSRSSVPWLKDNQVAKSESSAYRHAVPAPPGTSEDKHGATVPKAAVLPAPLDLMPKSDELAFAVKPPCTCF